MSVYILLGYQMIFSSLNHADIYVDVEIFASYSSTDSVWFILTRCMILMIDWVL